MMFFGPLLSLSQGLNGLNDFIDFYYFYYFNYKVVGRMVPA